MQIQDVTRLFKTLSDPTRLRLLRLMSEAELSVMELAEVTQLAQSRVSNHLKVLREEGFLQERRQGAWRHYRLDSDRLPDRVKPLWQNIAAAWEDDESYLADQSRLREVIAARTERQGAFFDKMAERWDAIRDELFGDTIARQILRAFIPSDIVVADIGCGTGFVLELFGDRPAKIIGIDNNKAMLSVAKKKAKAHGWDRAEFRVGDALKPPLKEGEADLVTLVMVLHHLEEPARAVAAAAKALKPGGRLLVADFFEHQETWLRDRMAHRWLGFNKSELEKWCAEAGLEEMTCASLPGRREGQNGDSVSVPDGFALIAMKSKGRKK